MQELKKNYFKFYNKKFYEFTNLLVIRLFLSRFSIIKKKPGAKICDLGCGRTSNIDFFNFLKYKYYGVDISVPIVKLLNKNHKCNNFYLGSNDKTSFSNNYFDFLISIHSFYYLKDEHTTLTSHLNEAKRILKKDGLFIVTFPKKNYPNYKIVKYKKIYKIKSDKFKIRNSTFVHNLFTKKEITNFFKKDFKILDIGYLDYELNSLSEKHHWCILQKK